MARTSYERTVRYSDSDAQGVVFNANYFVYFDDVMTDHFRAVGLGPEEIERRGIEPVVAHAECDYLAAGRIGDRLVTTVRTESIGTKSIVFVFEVAVAGSDRVIARGREVYVMLDEETGESIHVPDDLRLAFAPD